MRDAKRNRTAFVLSGGGNMGALQVGMLRALTERAIVPELVLGCSVGAMNGAAFARAPNRAGVMRLESHWLSATSPQLMPSSRIPSAVQLLRKGASLHRNDGLRSSLQDVLGEARRFEDLVVPFECVATEVETAREHWFSEGELVPALLASAALPAVFPPVELDGHRYVDGGVVDNVPIDRAVQLGCTTVVVLHVGAQGRPDADLRRPIDGALLAYWLARNSRFARDLAALPAGVDAIVLPTGERPDLRYDDFSQSEALIEQGYSNALAFLDERAERLTSEESHHDNWRTRLSRIVRTTRTRAAARSGPVGVVLCGGASRRMGADKALLGSPPWAMRVANALSGAGCEPVVLLGGSTELTRWGLEQIPDDEPGAGPLAALTAVQRRWPDRTLVVAACDLPELTPEEVEPLLDSSTLDTGPRVTLYESEGRFQWSLTVVNPAAALRLAELVGDGSRALRDLAPWSRALPAPQGSGIHDIDDPSAARERGLDPEVDAQDLS